MTDCFACAQWTPFLALGETSRGTSDTGGFPGDLRLTSRSVTQLTSRVCLLRLLCDFSVRITGPGFTTAFGVSFGTVAAARIPSDGLLFLLPRPERMVPVMIRTGISVGLICVACVTGFAEEIASSPDGFVSLFNGQDLSGWDCDKRFWRVEDGVIIGETTDDNPAPHNTFLIRSGTYGDFELRFSYQVRSFNSGVQYRSVLQDDYVVKGYQADFEARWHNDGTLDKFSGMFFEENGRMFMGKRGEAVIVRPAAEGKKKPEIEVVGSLGDSAELEQAINREGWNDYVIIAKGFQFTHIINGKVVALAWDEDTKNRRAEGVFAFQLHSGPPMQIKIKDVKVRRL